MVELLQNLQEEGTMLQNTNEDLDSFYDEVLKFYGYPPRNNEVSSSVSEAEKEQVQQANSNIFED